MNSASATSDSIIEATDIHKTYDTGRVQVHALRGVSLTVPRGEMVAIMGPSGCGKTTLLNCLSGLDSIDSGRILIEGVDINNLSDNRKTEYRAHRMGFVFQFYNLLPVLSAVENVELPLLVGGVGTGEARERSLAALGRVGLGDWASHRPAELSGGQRQRVTIARSLVNDPAIVWADEPTGDLDSANAAEIMNLMNELNTTQNQTFVIVTHAQEVAARTDRIIQMVDGVIVNEEATSRDGAQAAAGAQEPARSQDMVGGPWRKNVVTTPIEIFQPVRPGQRRPRRRNRPETERPERA